MADHGATTYEWPIPEAGPFIAWRDGYGFDQVLREAQRINVQFDQLHRALYGQPGYHEPGNGYARPNLAQAVERIRVAQLQRTSEANRKHQQAAQQLSQLRRLIGYLQVDEDGPAEGLINGEELRALLDRPDCGGPS